MVDISLVETRNAIDDAGQPGRLPAQVEVQPKILLLMGSSPTFTFLGEGPRRAADRLLQC